TCSNATSAAASRSTAAAAANSNSQPAAAGRAPRPRAGRLARGARGAEPRRLRRLDSNQPQKRAPALAAALSPRRTSPRGRRRGAAQPGGTSPPGARAQGEYVPMTKKLLTLLAIFAVASLSVPTPAQPGRGRITEEALVLQVNQVRTVQ